MSALSPSLKFSVFRSLSYIHQNKFFSFSFSNHIQTYFSSEGAAKAEAEAEPTPGSDVFSVAETVYINPQGKQNPIKAPALHIPPFV